MSHPSKNLTRADWRLVTFVPLSILGIIGAALYPGLKEWYAGATTPCSTLLSEAEIQELTGKPVDHWSHSKDTGGCRSEARSALKKYLVGVGVSASCPKEKWHLWKSFESVETLEGPGNTELATLSDGYQLWIGVDGNGCISSGFDRTPTNRDRVLRLAKLLQARRDVAAEYVRELGR